MPLLYADFIGKTALFIQKDHFFALVGLFCDVL
jgi:hypothetical protein